MAQSPPSAEELSEFRQQLLQNNGGGHYGNDNYLVDQGYLHSGSNSGYITPDPNHMLEQHGSHFINQYTGQYEPSSMLERDVYGHPMYFQQQRQEYYPVPSNQYPSPVPFQYTSSPPTPSPSDLSSSGKRKRPNRSHAANNNTSSGPSAPRAKKAKPAKGEKAKTPKLDAPLSVLTKDSDVPLKDMHAWVHRSAEDRLQEVANRPKNKITRPMNSFMLYRSAYADRTKRWCTQNNHQVVSSVSGESWPMEPKEIKDLYTEYARIERDNHQKAHPGYKFSPTKPGSAGRKQRKDASEEEDEESDLDTMDGEYMPSSRSRFRRPRHATPEPSWIGGYQNQYGHHASTMAGNPEMQPSSYQYTNPNKPLPAPMIDNGLYGQYYQTIVQAKAENIEDVLIQKTSVPGGVSYSTAQALSSVPGGGHHELLDDSFGDSHANLERTDFESSLDPSLTDTYGTINDTFLDQQPTEQDPELGHLQTYTYPNTPTQNHGADDWKDLQEETTNNLSDEAISNFLREANGS